MLKSFVFVAMLLVGEAAFAKCADLGVSDREGLENAFRAVGGKYTPLPSRYMHPTCLVSVNYNARALSNVRHIRAGRFEPMVVFYDNVRDARRDNRDPNGFKRWDIVIGVMPYNQSAKVAVVADFYVKFGKPEVKTLTKRIPGWGRVDILYLYRAFPDAPDKSKVLAFFEVPPPKNSMAARKGVKLVYGQTQDLVVDSRNVRVPAFLLADVLTSVQLPALSQEEFLTHLGDQ
ncbi:hypothetical protein [uncultured Ruegeria sp.]|uniref:hypothetical protein n=1 Tax=uncultured Ruegeria sp. TaxID=259304 RepID=UPI00262838E3|nr:hypothetical protein [uncultured Ruegeria sp.]